VCTELVTEKAFECIHNSHKAEFDWLRTHVDESCHHMVVTGDKCSAAFLIWRIGNVVVVTVDAAVRPGRSIPSRLCAMTVVRATYHHALRMHALRVRGEAWEPTVGAQMAVIGPLWQRFMMESQGPEGTAGTAALAPETQAGKPAEKHAGEGPEGTVGTAALAGEGPERTASAPEDAVCTSHPMRSCAACNRGAEPGPMLKCGGCKQARYCCQECATKHWKVHREECKWKLQRRAAKAAQDAVAAAQDAAAAALDAAAAAVTALEAVATPAAATAARSAADAAGIAHNRSIAAASACNKAVMFHV
jgi:hypothetical protein